MSKKKKKPTLNTLATNKKARFDYQILDQIEAGIELIGCEVKSIRNGDVTLRESYVKLLGNEVWLVGCHISPYEHGNIMNGDPVRDRKLLLHRREINRLAGRISQKNEVLVALSLYLSKNRIKLKIGIGVPKKLHDKRDSLKKKAIQRDMDRTYRG